MQEGQAEKKKNFKYIKITIGVVIFLTVIFLSLMSTYFYCYRPMNKHERHFEKALIAVIKSGNESVYLKDLIEFEWESVCAIPPYAQREEVEKLLGFAYDDYDKLYWIDNEAFVTLLFIDRKQNIEPIRIRRWKTLEHGGADYSVHNEKCMGNAKAKFAINSASNNKKWFELTEGK